MVLSASSASAASGKWPVRERLDALLDPATFVEYGLLADHMEPSLAAKGSFAADGCVTGIGEIDGRRVAVCAYDFTVQAGSMGRVNEFKVTRLRELVLRQRIPMIWLLDSAGARITSDAGSTFAANGALFREQVTLSGVVPQVAAMVGHCAAGTAYIPALADFVPMVKGTSSMALAGRHLVKAATGEDVTEEEMGGSEVHTKVSGVADLEVADDAACLAVVRSYLSYFPSSNTDAAARHLVRRPGRPPGRSPVRHRSHRPASGLRHAQGHRRGGRSRIVLRDEGRAGRATSSPDSPASVAIRSASSDPTRWCWAVRST